MEFLHDVPRSGTNHSVDQAINSKSTAWKYGVSGDQAEQQDLYMATDVELMVIVRYWIKGMWRGLYNNIADSRISDDDDEKGM